MSLPTCSIDSDCEEGYECIGGRCVQIRVNPPPAQLPGLGYFLRPRYSCNLAITDQASANDILNDVIFVSSRMYMAQAANGKISFRNKKPAPWALGTAAFSIGATNINVDSVMDWISNVDNFLLIAPHTSTSEMRRVTGSAYSTAQNSVTFTSTGGLFTITGFTGCDGANTPATAHIVVNSATASTNCTVTLEGISFAFRTSASGETKQSIASYIAGMIASHPSLFRRFKVVWATGADTVYLTALFGSLTLDNGLQFATPAPVANPATAPTLAASGTSTALKAGVHNVAYAWVNPEGETLISPFKAITLTATQKIDVSAVTLPSGVSSVRWFVSPQENSTKLRFVVENNGAAFSITVLPLLSAPLPPDLNRTGTEVIKVAAVFSDRTEPRSAMSKSNVLRATFSWLLGNRENSINRIDLKYRDATQDWRLVELRLRDDANIAKIKKTSNLEVNGQAIDNTDQAYRITAGLLAEKQDANFFYKWQATREALLLQEGDVVAITDSGSGVYNLPVSVEEIEFDLSDGGLPSASFTGRKYASTLYDDSVVENKIPVVIEP